MEAPDSQVVSEPARVPKKDQRRRHSREFKQRVLAEVLARRESVSVIARRHDLNANLVFKWKRLHLAGNQDAAVDSTQLMPIQVDELTADQTVDSDAGGRIEIVLGGGRRITIRGEVSRDALQTALEILLQ